MADIEKSFYSEIANLLEQARKHVQRTTNTAMVYTYYEIGRRIVEEEQHGEDRAKYGAELLKGLSSYLADRFGKGFSVTNLKQMRKFYRVYSSDQKRQMASDTLQVQIGQTASDQSAGEIRETSFTELTKRPKTYDGNVFFLSWSHYLKLMRISNPDERHFYKIEAARNDWSLSELNRQTESALYERLALSRDKEKVRELAEKGQIIYAPADAVKDPYVLEFLGLKEEAQYSEQELETRIIDHLQEFLLELGRGFTFVGRQQRFTFDYEHFYVDLVFYNRLLRCFVLFDLKLDKLTHQDIGQMQMYVHYYDRYVKLDDESPTIGILLCKEKNDAAVELTLPESEKDQIFASKYETVLPSKEELKRLLEEC